MAEGPLQEAVQGKAVDIEWMPFELRPAPTETLKPEGDYLQKAWKQSIYPMAERMGVKIVLPRVSPQPYTRLAFEGYQFAKEQGLGNEYNHRMFTAFFQEELDIGKLEVLTKLAGELGLDEQQFRTALAAGTYRQLHAELLDHAYEEMKISAVPTFVIGRRVLAGLYDAETLKQVIEDEAASLEIDATKRGEVCGPDGC